MSERTLAQPLSGEEIVTAVLEKIRGKLVKDCYLNPVSAYEGFSGKVTFHLRMRDIGRYPEVNGEVQVDLGEEMGPDAATVEAVLDLEEEAPNDVRVETGQGVPTLIETSDGKREIKPIHYARKPGRPRKNVDAS